MKPSLTLSALALLTYLAPFHASTSHAKEMIDFPAVQLRALDKITARTLTFQADVGSTVKFGSLFVRVQACRKAPPVEQPESAAFLQIWEERQDKEISSIGSVGSHAEWVFSGWMFASSPALSYMDHPIYDVWILDCLEEASEQMDGDALEGEGMVEDDQTNGPAITVPSIPDASESLDDQNAAPSENSAEKSGAPITETPLLKNE